MKKRIISGAVIFLMISASLMFTACDLFGTDDDSDADSGSPGVVREQPDDFDDPAYDNEADEAELVEMPHEKDDYIGSWSARSEQAQYLFGNVDLKIYKDGKWNGNITEEAFSGKWRYTNSAVIITDSEGIIRWRLFFVADGSLMFEDLDDPDLTPLVLKKQS